MLNIKNNYNKSSEWAFTLAEVLITLGIIGIVAALTIPVLVNQYEKSVITTKSPRPIVY